MLMTTRTSRSGLLLAYLWLFILPGPARAAITWTGSVGPGDPTTWTSSTYAHIGGASDGTIAVSGGSGLLSRNGFLGPHAGASGEVTVTGAGSQWNVSSELHVGRAGSGKLHVEDGGQVTAGTLFASLTDLHGDGAISATEGAILDGDLLFNTTHGTQSVLPFGSGGTLTVTAGESVLGAGYKGTGTLTVADGIVVRSLHGRLGYRAGSSGEATVVGSGSVWNSGSITVGSEGDGKLNIFSGGTVTNSTSGDVGYSRSSTGEVRVAGPGSQWNSGLLHVGYSGSGTLSIQAGGTITSSHGQLAYNQGSTGVAIVSGLGSQWNNTSDLLVGRSGDGTLNIQAGGTVTSNRQAVLGDLSGSTGKATVTGVGSQWNNLSDLHVGSEGSGTLNILAGGSVTNDETYLGYEAGSRGEATIADTGSEWSNNSRLWVGYRGNGTLNIHAGGTVTNSSRDAYLGYAPDSTGEATVSGTGSQWNGIGSLYVGYDGAGTLNIHAGGAVTTAGSRVGFQSDSTGDVTVSGAGSQWNITSHLWAGYGGDASLNILAGGTVTSPRGGTVGNSPNSRGEVIVSGAGSRWISTGEPVVDRSGESRMLTIGKRGSGELTISDGGLVIAAGLLNIDYNLSGDSFVNLSTGGMLALKSDETGDDSLEDFLELVAGTQAIRYWDYALADWAPITAATYGDDYTLTYLTTGELAGYTLLTVAVPEPTTAVQLLVAACIGLDSGRRRGGQVWRRR